MKKRLVALLLMFICVMNISAPAYAAEVSNSAQQELNKNMSEVFAYLNEQETLSLKQLEIREYEIPLENGEVVSVEVRNEQVPTGRAGGNSGLGSEYYPITEGVTYNYTLTIKNFYLFSGEMIYNINYTVGAALNKNNRRFKVNSTNLTATAPIGCSVSEINTWDNTTGGDSVILVAEGTVLFDVPLTYGLGMYIKITLTGWIDELQADYIYADIDDVIN